MSKTNYFLKIEIYGSAFSLFVNNIRILQNKKGQGISFNYPINPYILNGENEVEIILNPAQKKTMLDHESKCKISILYNSKNSTDQKLNEIASSIAPFFDTEDPNYSYSNKLTFNALVSFQDPLWTRSPNLKNNPDILRLLTEKYQLIYEILQKKELNEMLKLMEIRQKEISSCMYITEDEVCTNTIEGLNANFNNSNWVLSEFNEQSVEIKFYAYGKLVRFEGLKGESPLKFRDEERRLTSSYDFFFCMNPDDNKLTIIR